jgi:hypothetical protein
VITLAGRFYCIKTARKATSLSFTIGIRPYSIIKKKNESLYESVVKTAKLVEHRTKKTPKENMTAHRNTTCGDIATGTNVLTRMSKVTFEKGDAQRCPE